MEKVPSLILNIGVLVSGEPPSSPIVILKNNNVNLSFSGTGMGYIRGVTGTVKASDGSSANLTLNKASVTVKKLEASVGATNVSFTYAKAPADSSLSGSLAAHEGTEIELAFVLSSNSDKVKGGKIYIDILSDQSVSFTASNVLALYESVVDSGKISVDDITTFLKSHGLSVDKDSVTVSVKDNNNAVQYSKTFKGSELVSFVPGSSS
jgi:hypothetical protein